jgi:pSer/pThr/pTyr-binding forkhead associated (FHA) protein
MYIKVEVESQEPVVYKVNHNEILIGSSPSNSIVIKEHTLSKKHLKIIEEDGSWFVIDQGSTNGSFVDEEQLIPGKRTKITSESVVSLGDKVTLFFPEEAESAIDINPPATAIEEAPANLIKSDHEKTQVLSMADLQAIRAQVNVKKKKEIIVKKAQEIKRKKIEKKKVNKMAIISILIVLIGLIANNAWKNRMKKINKDGIIKKMQTKFSDDLQIEAEVEGFRIPRGSLLTKNKLASRVLLPKCNQLETTEYCVLPNMKGFKNNGVVFLTPASMIFFVDQRAPVINAQASLSEGETIDDNALLKKAFIIYFQENFPGLTFPKDTQVYVVFYKQDSEGTTEITRVSAFYESSIPMMLQSLKEQDFTVTDTYFSFF